MNLSHGCLPVGRKFVSGPGRRLSARTLWKLVRRPAVSLLDEHRRKSVPTLSGNFFAAPKFLCSMNTDNSRCHTADSRCPTLSVQQDELSRSAPETSSLAL